MGRARRGRYGRHHWLLQPVGDDDECRAHQARHQRRPAVSPLSGLKMAADTVPRIQGLEALIAAQAATRRPPVDSWHPPYCGDIGMEIRADGTWYYRDSPIARLALVKLFASVLRKDADGRHYLVTPAERVDVRVADAPFLAVEMEVRGTGREHTLVFRTNVDDVVEAGPAHPLRFEIEPGSQGLKPYLIVRGRLEALVTRALYYDLVELAVDEGDGLGLWSGGAFFVMSAAAV